MLENLVGLASLFPRKTEASRHRILGISNLEIASAGDQSFSSRKYLFLGVRELGISNQKSSRPGLILGGGASP